MNDTAALNADPSLIDSNPLTPEIDNNCQQKVDRRLFHYEFRRLPTTTDPASNPDPVYVSSSEGPHDYFYVPGAGNTVVFYVVLEAIGNLDNEIPLNNTKSGNERENC